MGKQSSAPPKYTGNFGTDASNAAGYLGNQFQNGFMSLGNFGQPMVQSVMDSVTGAPKSGDYMAGAEKQGQLNQQSINQQTQANRPGQNTPFGFTQWTQDANGNWTQNSGLNGGLGTAATGLQGQAGQLASPMDWSQFGQLDDGSAAREQAINASVNSQMARLNPMLANQQDSMRTELANAGLDPNSQAARGARSDFNSSRNDAVSGVLNSAIREGTAAQQATFGQNMAARQQAIMEALKQRGQPIEELQALQGFTQMPGFMGAGAAAPTPYLEALMAKDGFNLGKWQTQQKMMGDMALGGGQLLSSFAKLAGG